MAPFYVRPGETSNILGRAQQAASAGGQLQAQAAQAFRPGDIIGNYLQREQDRTQRTLDNERAQQRLNLQIAQDQRAQSQEQRAAQQFQRNLDRQTATDAALNAVLNPQATVTAGTTPEEQAGISASLAALSPEEAAATQQAVQNEFVGRLTGAANVDQTAVGNLRNQLSNQENTKFNQEISKFNQAIRTPGTKEYNAYRKGELNLAEEKAKIQQKYAKTKDTRTKEQKNVEYLVNTLKLPRKEATELAFKVGKYGKGGTSKGGRSSSKGNYTVKDLDGLRSKISTFNFIGGDRGDLFDAESQLVDAARRQNIPQQQINNALGTAINSATDDDSVDVDTFRQAFSASIADQAGLQRNPQPASTATPQTTATNTAVTNATPTSAVATQPAGSDPVAQANDLGINPAVYTLPDGTVNLNLLEQAIQEAQNLRALNFSLGRRYTPSSPLTSGASTIDQSELGDLINRLVN